MLGQQMESVCGGLEMRVGSLTVLSLLNCHPRITSVPPHRGHQTNRLSALGPKSRVMWPLDADLMTVLLP